MVRVVTCRICGVPAAVERASFEELCLNHMDEWKKSMEWKRAQTAFMDYVHRVTAEERVRSEK